MLLALPSVNTFEFSLVVRPDVHEFYCAEKELRKCIVRAERAVIYCSGNFYFFAVCCLQSPLRSLCLY